MPRPPHRLLAVSWFMLAALAAASAQAHAPAPAAAPPPAAAVPAPSPAPSPAEVSAWVLDQARKALADAPLSIQADALRLIASREVVVTAVPSPQAMDDSLAALRVAAALAAAHPASQTYRAFQRQTAMATALAVMGFFPRFQQLAFEPVHAFVQSADLPKAPLYTALVGEFSLPAGFTQLGMAQECFKLDGSFPYQGVLLALAHHQSPVRDQSRPDEAVPLLRAAYTAAASDQDWSAYGAIAELFGRGHAALPQLDPAMEDALLSVLRHLQQGPPDPPPPPAWDFPTPDRPGDAATVRQQLAPGLLALLAQFDPGRAAELRTEIPFSSPPPAAPAAAAIPNSPAAAPAYTPAISIANPQDALRPLLAAPASSDSLHGLMSLVPAIATSDPVAAASVIAAILRDLDADPGLLPSNLSQLAAIAPIIAGLANDKALAAQFQTRILDGAEADLVALQSQYDNGDDARRIAIESHLIAEQLPGAIGAFLFLSQADYNATLARVLALPTPLTRGRALTVLGVFGHPPAPPATSAP